MIHMEYIKNDENLEPEVFEGESGEEISKEQFNLDLTEVISRMYAVVNHDESDECFR